jgi:uncharacterized hydantoinase/oxoprolinase family protein
VHPATVIASESEAIQRFGAKNWIASSQVLLAMTPDSTTAVPCDIFSRDMAAIPGDIAPLIAGGRRDG